MGNDFHFLVQRYERPVYNFFANRGFTREECQELTQETFLELHRSGGRFRGEASLVTWVLSIAKNVWLRTIRDSHRAKRRAELLSLDWLAEAGQLQSVEANIMDTEKQYEPLERVLGAERARLLRLAVGALPETTRNCLLLYYAQDRKCREIAVALQMSESAVKFHLAQARGKLKESLAEYFSDSLH